MKNNHLNDIELLNKIKGGDQDSFRLLFENHYAAVSRYINFFLNDIQESEQLALDIFAHVWENRLKIKINISLRSYFMTAARNRSLNYIRDNKSNKHLNLSYFNKVHEEYSIELKELDVLIREAISSLPPKCGEIFRLSRDKELTNKEISEKTGISVKTIESHITKALKLIRNYLGDAYNYLW